MDDGCAGGRPDVVLADVKLNVVVRLWQWLFSIDGSAFPVSVQGRQGLQDLLQEAERDE